MLAAAALALALDAAAGVPRRRWLALHLASVGGISQLVVGTAQFFACAFLATDPPPRRLLRAHLAVWNAGVVAIAAGAALVLLAAAYGVLGAHLLRLAVAVVLAGPLRTEALTARGPGP
jgi:hypothetical protein